MRVVDRCAALAASVRGGSQHRLQDAYHDRMARLRQRHDETVATLNEGPRYIDHMYTDALRAIGGMPFRSAGQQSWNAALHQTQWSHHTCDALPHLFPAGERLAFSLRWNERGSISCLAGCVMYFFRFGLDSA